MFARAATSAALASQGYVSDRLDVKRARRDEQHVPLVVCSPALAHMDVRMLALLMHCIGGQKCHLDPCLLLHAYMHTTAFNLTRSSTDHHLYDVDSAAPRHKYYGPMQTSRCITIRQKCGMTESRMQIWGHRHAALCCWAVLQCEQRQESERVALQAAQTDTPAAPHLMPLCPAGPNGTAQSLPIT